MIKYYVDGFKVEYQQFAHLLGYCVCITKGHVPTNRNVVEYGTWRVQAMEDEAKATHASTGHGYAKIQAVAKFEVIILERYAE